MTAREAADIALERLGGRPRLEAREYPEYGAWVVSFGYGPDAGALELRGDIAEADLYAALAEVGA